MTHYRRSARFAPYSTALLASVVLSFMATVTHAGTIASDAGQEWTALQKRGTDAVYDARYGDAERALNQAVFKAAVFGESDVRLAKSLGELGRLYTVRGRFDEAEPLLQEELRVYELALGQDSTELIPHLQELIHFYLRHGSLDKASPYTEHLLSLVEGKLKAPSVPAEGVVKLQKGVPLTAWAGSASLAGRDPLVEWAITCDALGEDYRLRDNFDYADRLYKAALDVKFSVYGKEHLSLANSYDNLGTLCLEHDEDADAESYFKDSLAITEKILPAQDPQVYNRLDKLAKVYLKQKKHDKAEQLYLRAQTFWVSKEPINPLSAKRGAEARAKYALGSLYLEEKRYEEASVLLQQALHLAEEYHGIESITLVPYLQMYSNAMYYLGQKEETSELRARAIAITGVVQQ